ncbi:hypothetical protein JKF63_01185 [Porcisia hertigi]|uniref:Uncharacterized protein n=1 Tax=Porcisia hertigi TaxID=2761500 RepID=A0A836KZ75_9TRYP|nr:hypothetical protein JKF63_01185 [Porcisia hertigi]
MRALGGEDCADAPVLDKAVGTSTHCFYCLCTVCGQGLVGVPTVTCDACGSRTHITCARDVYSNDWLYDEVAVASTVATGVGGSAVRFPNTLPAVGRNRQMPGTVQASQDSEGTSGVVASSSFSVSSPLSRDSSLTSLLPSPEALRSAAARIDKTYTYYCHPDCAMGMAVLRNPQFNAAVSRTVECAFEREWARVRDSLVSAGVLRDPKHHVLTRDGTAVEKQTPPAFCLPVTSTSAASVKMEGSGEHTESPSLCSPPPPPSSPPPPSCPTVSVIDMHDCASHASASVFLDIAVCEPEVAKEVLRLYHQLRAEAWTEYFEQERHHFGHPLFYPPPFLDIAQDAAVGHVVEAASPQGQAARLYLLDHIAHPVGSAVAIPVGVLTRWQQSSAAPLIKANDSNNFVAESLERIANEALVPETVVLYHKCGKEGQVLV